MSKKIELKVLKTSAGLQTKKKEILTLSWCSLNFQNWSTIAFKLHGSKNTLPRDQSGSTKMRKNPLFDHATFLRTFQETNIGFKCWISLLIKLTVWIHFTHKEFRDSFIKLARSSWKCFSQLKQSSLGRYFRARSSPDEASGMRQVHSLDLFCLDLEIGTWSRLQVLVQETHPAEGLLADGAAILFGLEMGL